MLFMIWMLGILISLMGVLVIFNVKGYWNVTTFLSTITIWTLCVAGYGMRGFLL